VVLPKRGKGVDGSYRDELYVDEVEDTDVGTYVDGAGVGVLEKIDVTEFERGMDLLTFTFSVGAHSIWQGPPSALTKIACPFSLSLKTPSQTAHLKHPA
jgi:hypothetical protein